MSETQSPWTVLAHAVTGIDAQLRFRRSPHLGGLKIEDCIPERQETIAALKALPLATRFAEVLDELAEQERGIVEFAAKLRRKEAAVTECTLHGGDLTTQTISRDGAKGDLDDVIRYRDELHQAASEIHAELVREHKAASEKLSATVGGMAIGDAKRLKAELAARIGDLLDQLARVQEVFARGRLVTLPSPAELFGSLPAKAATEAATPAHVPSPAFASC